MRRDLDIELGLVASIALLLVTAISLLQCGGARPAAKCHQERIGGVIVIGERCKSD